MPVIGRGDEDGIDILAIEHAPEIGIAFSPSSAFLSREVRQRPEDIAHGGQFHAGILEVDGDLVIAAGAESNLADDDPIIGSQHPAEERSGRSSSQCPLNEDFLLSIV